MNETKYVIFHVEGGLGKTVASTALIQPLKQQYQDRELIVVSGYPEIFLNNPNVNKCYLNGNLPYFWESYIHNKDTVIFRHEPYLDELYYKQNTHIIDIWGELCNVEPERQPILYPNAVQQSYQFNWKTNKPILLLHTHGGPIQKENMLYSWSRDMPPTIANALVEQYRNTHHIIQLCSDERQSLGLDGVQTIYQKMSNFELFSLLQAADKRVLIDSSLQHAAAAYGLESTVLWIGTNPKVFGYEMHNNIVANTPNKNNLPDSSYVQYQLVGTVHECPYQNFDEMFNVSEVISTI